ncbi:hypothetical protein BASA_1640 [Bifidobacterium animalis subsp. animalis]|nr:hypothetical protein BASA_1640 [Bifidobacterium animalis subsp. animalis]
MSPAASLCVKRDSATDSAADLAVIRLALRKKGQIGDLCVSFYAKGQWRVWRAGDARQMGR